MGQLLELESVPLDLMREIVRRIAGAVRGEHPAQRGGQAALEPARVKLGTLNIFARTSKAMRDLSLGYVMSLAPRSVVRTVDLLDMMRHSGIRSQVLLAASSPRAAALLARIADLTPSVIEELRTPLQESLARATVGGAAMYSSDPGTIAALTERIIARLKEREERREDQAYPKMKRPYPKVQNGSRSVSDFLALSAADRMRLAEKHGPLCLWDVSDVTSLDTACGVDAVCGIDGVQTPSFSSDLYWDTSKCTDMNGVFFHNAEFHGDLSTWDMSHVTDADQMFRGSGVSDSGIGNWDVGRLVSARFMFAEALQLSPDLSLSGWNVDSAKFLEAMFRGSAIRDGGIGKWPIGSDVDTRDMLAGTTFEGGLDKWPKEQARAANAPPRATGQMFGRTRHESRDALVEREFATIARELSATRREEACRIL